MKRLIAAIAVVFVLFGCEISDNTESEYDFDDFGITEDTSDVEKEVVREMNAARTNPSQYAELYIEPRIQKFSGNIYDGRLRTSEGATAVRECVAAMKSARAVKAVRVQRGLNLAAKQHALSQGETSQTGHTGVDGSSPFERIEKYGTYTSAGENIAYGSRTGREIVVQLLIDDGVQDRGHRENIMSADFDSAGVGYSDKHGQYGSVCVIDYAGGYKEK